MGYTPLRTQLRPQSALQQGLVTLMVHTEWRPQSTLQQGPVVLMVHTACLGRGQKVSRLAG